MKQTNISSNMSTLVSQVKKLGKKVLLKKNKLTTVILAGVLIFGFSIFTYYHNTAYAVKINGKTVGVVRDKDDFTKVIDTIRDNFYKTYEAEMVFNETIEYEKIKAKKNELTSAMRMESTLKQVMSLKVKAFGIKANGKLVSVLATQAESEKVLEEIKNPYISNLEGIQDVYFGENVIIEEIAIEMKGIRTLEDTVKLIQKGTEEVKVHEVQKGESLWTIAKKYNLSVAELEEANPEVNPDKLQIKQPINLIVPKPLLTVVTVRRSRYEDNIPFPVEFEETATLYKGENKIKVAGKDGKREVYAEIVEHNDVEVTRNILEEKIITEPNKQIVLKGTKELPPKIGTGTFSNPTRGTLSSRFGWRWGRQHEGIDIAAKIGTTITAADGGKVTFSGTKSGYGKLVIIDHGGGFETYYGHCSKLLVSKGDKVYKGQKIAEVGNTGKSTGPHLHFEVRKNGKPINPLSYVKY